MRRYSSRRWSVSATPASYARAVKLRTSSAGQAAGWYAIFSVFAVVAMIGLAVYTDGSLGSVIYLVGTVLAGVGSFFAWRSRSTCLRIDLERSMATYLVGRREVVTVRLDELLPLTIELVGSKHRLMSPAIPAPLMTESYVPFVEARRDMLQQLADVHVLRQLFVDAVPSGEMYRDAPDVMFRVKTAFPDDARLQAALAELVDDPHVGAQARAMATRGAGVQDADKGERSSEG